MAYQVLKKSVLLYLASKQTRISDSKVQNEICTGTTKINMASRNVVIGSTLMKLYLHT